MFVHMHKEVRRCSLIDVMLKEVTVLSDLNCLVLLVCGCVCVCCNGCLVYGPFHCIKSRYPPPLLYITPLDGGIEKTNRRRKETVFHPISLERQCCALVIE